MNLWKDSAKDSHGKILFVITECSDRMQSAMLRIWLLVSDNSFISLLTNSCSSPMYPLTGAVSGSAGVVRSCVESKHGSTDDNRPVH